MTGRTKYPHTTRWVPPGIRPGNSVTCDLVTSSERLPITDSKGEVSHGLYRIGVHYQDEVIGGDEEFYPSCLHGP